MDHGELTGERNGGSDEQHIVCAMDRQAVEFSGRLRSDRSNGHRGQRVEFDPQVKAGRRCRDDRMFKIDGRSVAMDQ